MPGPWITNDVLKTAVAAKLAADDPATLGPRWDGIVANANADAAADLQKLLEGMGYTVAQVDQWDDRRNANRRLGTMYAIVNGFPPGAVKKEDLEGLDPRPAIYDDKLRGGISIGGVPTGPTIGASQVGGVAYGRSEWGDQLSREYDRMFGERSGGCW